MSALKLNAKKALAMLGVLPSLHPRPNETNLNKLKLDLVKKLSTVPCYQSMDKGYGDMVEDITVYAL